MKAPKSHQPKTATRSKRSNGGTKDADLRRQAARRLAHLPTERLRVALDFLRYLEEYADRDLVEDLTQVSGLRKAVAQAERQVASGRSYDWRKVRDDV